MITRLEGISYCLPRCAAIPTKAATSSERFAAFDNLRPGTTYDIAVRAVKECPATSPGIGMPTAKELAEDSLTIQIPGDGLPQFTTLPLFWPTTPTVRVTQTEATSFRVNIDNWSSDWHIQLSSNEDEQFPFAPNVNPNGPHGHVLCEDGNGLTPEGRTAEFTDLKPHTEYRFVVFSGLCPDDP